MSRISISFRTAPIATLATLLIVSVVLAQGLPKGTKAPDFSLNDTAGKNFKLSSNKGKVVFVNFFATWCGPCRVEFPEVVKLHEKYGKKNVKVISVSVDGPQTIQSVKPFAQKYKAKHQVLLGGNASQVFDKYANTDRAGIPMNVLIGKDGKVVKNWVGFSGASDVSQWESAINSSLK